MRKLAAILLLLIFFFNLCGYKILISFLQTKADQQLEALIDNEEYADDELIEMRVSLNMPYQQRYTEFERHYGHITIEGKEYTYVKRKIEGDILVLKCIANTSRTQLNQITSDIARSNNNNTQEQGPAKSAVKIFSFECDDVFEKSAIAHKLIIPTTYPTFTDELMTSDLTVPSQPPRHAIA